MPYLEVRRTHPYQETTGISVQVSSKFYQYTLVHCNRQIHEDLGVPTFANHFRLQTERFDSKLVDVGKPLIRQLSIYICWRSANPGRVKRTKGEQYRESFYGYLPNGGYVDAMNRAQLELSPTLTEVFILIFP